MKNKNPLYTLNQILNGCKMAPLTKEEEEKLREESLRDLQIKIKKLKKELSHQQIIKELSNDSSFTII
ncbi:MAG: hypothetical protein SPL03_12770 [Succinivibrio dextrinosolvens]|nr:hypothetical protein [Succinivibrio dextrinosolvens]